MEIEARVKILHLLDVISVEVAASHGKRKPGILFLIPAAELRAVSNLTSKQARIVSAGRALSAGLSATPSLRRCRAFHRRFIDHSPVAAKPSYLTAPERRRYIEAMSLRRAPLHLPPPALMNVARFETFSDSVFAIAATLLVFNLHVPDLSNLTGAQSTLRLASLWPQLLEYATSFAIIGVLWINHHALFHFLKKVDRVSLIINLVLLMCVAFIPYPTALMAQYPSNRATVILFGSTMAAAGFVFSALWFYAVRQHFRYEPRIDRRFIRDASLWTIGYPAAYVLATALALVDPRLSIALYAVIPIVYLLPGVIDRQLHLEMTNRPYHRDADVS